MKKTGILIAGITLIAMVVGCNKARRSPGRTYMPDMAYSRAYETYSSTEALQQAGASYNAKPVTGTVARGDMAWQYPYANDSAGYANSKNVSNPLPPLTAEQFIEAARLYLVNCAICHGEKLDGNGPLYKDGEGPYLAKPAALVGDPKYTSMAPGTMYHSITYGINKMGGYASQLSTEQRWMVVHYIKEKQANTGSGAAAKAPADSTTGMSKMK